jgi:hypothetical protein
MPKKRKTKTKRRKTTQPLQSQKQVVNINFREEKKKKRKKSRKPQNDQLKTSVQILGSNLNMLGSETARLNNLENLINELRREQNRPITIGRPTPEKIKEVKVQAKQVQAKQVQAKQVIPKVQEQEETKTDIIVPPAPPTTPTPLRKKQPLTEDFLIPLRDDYMRDIEVGNFQLKETGDQADLLTKNTIPPYEKQKETPKEVKKKIRKRLKIRTQESINRPRQNVSNEPFETGGVDLIVPPELEPIMKKIRKERAIETEPRKEYDTKKRRAVRLYENTLLGKTFKALKDEATREDIDSYNPNLTPIERQRDKIRRGLEEQFKFYDQARKDLEMTEEPFAGLDI